MLTELCNFLKQSNHNEKIYTGNIFLIDVGTPSNIWLAVEVEKV